MAKLPDYVMDGGTISVRKMASILDF